MNKKFIVAALGLSAIVATPAFAQQPSATKCDKANAENCQLKGAKKQANLPNPFEGLNLSAEQQTKLEALKTECQAQRKANAEARKADKQNRQKANKEEARKARTEQLAKIKAILTPEQYVQFLENNYLCANRGGMKGKMAKAGKNGRNDNRRAHAGVPRGNRQASAPSTAQ